MTKLQEYIRNKKIHEMGLPKLYIVKSTRDGVDKPTERQVVEIITNVAFRGNERIPIDRYRVEEGYPYEVDILRGEKSGKEDSYGTGVGDLWSSSYFFSFSYEESEKYYQEESIRVQTKYPKTHSMRPTFTKEQLV